ncbi:virulence RhuM family protein [Ligilactobacillus murinus]|uniref:Cell filamentation protein Fic n=1 Tax=Ligilactobacillus murinus TaxID=1622 RepID=A0AAD0KX56_9LACO|nr:virulence RhuM family protein [Ligilactobacillus murinus]AWZ37923.1 cell filamentation protein Fic [Ligilactobacillus murinus]AWZ41086.1 cell filamentation protein Fic [Ligilactobacillus murinus]
MSTLPTKFLVYKTDDSNVTIDVIVDQETIWASQKSIAQLFGKSVSTINEHLKQIYSTEELSPESTIRKFRIVQNEGGHDVTRNINYYNLDVIISVGYRVNSIQATHFRQWATQTLKEYMIKGFVLDDERLKQGETLLGKDYFDELLERVRSIRASERRIWQKITDIFAEISVDYDKNSPITHRFYANVQNKFHYAITGQTAAEIIYHTADHNKEHMGLTTWKNAPDGRILKSDTKIAKNYLDEKQIKQLERNVTGYFDYVEDLIERRNTFTMEQFATSIDRFLEFREYRILEGHGSISMKDAQQKASDEYDIFNKTQKITSDFDKQIKHMLDDPK